MELSFKSKYLDDVRNYKLNVDGQSSSYDTIDGALVVNEDGEVIISDER